MDHNKHEAEMPRVKEEDRWVHPGHCVQPGHFVPRVLTGHVRRNHSAGDSGCPDLFARNGRSKVTAGHFPRCSSNGWMGVRTDKYGR